MRDAVTAIGTMSTKRIEPYNTLYMGAKVGLLGWTYGLRAEMQVEKTGVTVHLVNPGILLDAGLAMNNSLKTRQAMADAVAFGGGSKGGEVADAVVKAIKYDIPETTVNSKPWAWEEREPLTKWFKSISNSVIEDGLNK